MKQKKLANINSNLNTCFPNRQKKIVDDEPF